MAKKKPIKPERRHAGRLLHTYEFGQGVIRSGGAMQVGSSGRSTIVSGTHVSAEGQIALACGFDLDSDWESSKCDPRTLIHRSVKVVNANLKRSEDKEQEIGDLLAEAYQIVRGGTCSAIKNNVQNSKIDVHIFTNANVIPVQVTRAQPVDSWTAKQGDYETYHTVQQAVAEIMRAVHRKSKDATKELVLALDGFVLPFPKQILEAIAFLGAQQLKLAGFKEIWYIAPYGRGTYRLYPDPRAVQLLQKTQSAT